MGGGGDSGGGGLLGAIGDAIGGDAGKMLGAADLLEKTGLDLDQLGALAGKLKDYIEPLLGSELVQRILAKVPVLGDLLK